MSSDRFPDSMPSLLSWNQVGTVLSREAFLGSAVCTERPVLAPPFKAGDLEHIADLSVLVSYLCYSGGCKGVLVERSGPGVCLG